MRIVFRMAWRYFKSKKSVQAINIISWISIGAIAISAAAMIILFSVFNGLDYTIKKMYTTFNPEVKITPKKGKFFTLDANTKKQLKAIKGVAHLTTTIEDMALLSTQKEQKPATIKGVSNLWFRMSGMDSCTLSGTAKWPKINNSVPAIPGATIANSLRVDANNPFSVIMAFYPRQEKGITLNPATALTQAALKPIDAFRIQRDIDSKYILVPLRSAQTLFEQPGKISAVEIKTKRPTNVAEVEVAAKNIMGQKYKIQNRYEQNETLYMVLSSEKWMIYIVLLFVLLIASFNLTGCLYMLVLEKKKDISILKSMGMGRPKIRNLFLSEGLLLALAGAVTGIVLGFLIALGQMYFGWVSLPGGFVVSAYPVAFEGSDFILVFGTALVIGLLAAWYPAHKAGRQSVYVREE